MQELRDGVIKLRASRFERGLAKQLANTYGMGVAGFVRYMIYREAQQAGLVPTAAGEQRTQRGEDQHDDS